MRNLVLASETAKASGRRSGFVVAYADDPAFSFARNVQSEDWMRFASLLGQDVVAMRTLSHQALVAGAIEALAKAGMAAGPWPALKSFIEGKIDAVARGFGR